MPAEIKIMCSGLLEGVKNAAKIDEHGGWEFGVVASNYKKGMIHALNYDWYGVGYDLHDGGFLAVLQVREFYRRKSSRFPEIRKSYFLIGQNEDATYFAHPVQSHKIHAAIRGGKDVVKACQDWIFETDYAKVIRQGDLCLVPVRSIKGEEKNTEIVIEESHRLLADKVLENGHLYAVNPKLYHMPGTHPDVEGKGKYKVIVGRRASFWSFAKPTLD
ncbi:MAG: hypothetical protein KF852_04105 [Saprospiraceae bacterium]|nr:hypothetical protein [Saprospiraceae bacterium]